MQNTFIGLGLLSQHLSHFLHLFLRISDKNVRKKRVRKRVSLEKRFQTSVVGYIYILNLLVGCLGKIPNIFSQMVVRIGDFTMVESVKAHQKNKSKMLGSPQFLNAMDFTPLEGEQPYLGDETDHQWLLTTYESWDDLRHT